MTPESYAFMRKLEDEAILVALNTSAYPDRLVVRRECLLDLQIAVGELPEVEATDEGIAISLPARSGGLWVLTSA